VFTRKGWIGPVVVGILAGGASAAWPAGAHADEESRLPVIPAIYRIGPAPAGERSTTEATPVVGESQSPGGVLKAALERWRGGGSEGGVPVSTAIYRVEKPEPGESSSTEPASADDESESTGTDVKFDLVRWRGGWGRGWGWGGGWGRGWGWGGRRWGWGGGFRRWGWGGPGWGYGFYRPRFYRPFFYGGFGYPGYGYAYNGCGYGGYSGACGGCGYPGYGYAYNGSGYGGYPMSYGGYGYW
jgi:hypothetical protein